MIKPIIVFIDSGADVKALLRRLGVESYKEITERKCIFIDSMYDSCNLVYRVDFGNDDDINSIFSILAQLKDCKDSLYLYLVGTNNYIGPELESAYELLPSEFRATLVFQYGCEIIDSKKLTDLMQIKNGVITVSFKSSELEPDDQEPISEWSCENDENEILPSGTIAILKEIGGGHGGNVCYVNIEVLLEKEWTLIETLVLLETAALKYLKTQDIDGLDCFYIENIIRDGDRAIFEWGT